MRRLWLIAFVGVVGCSDGSEERAAPPVPETPPAVTVAPVALRAIANGATASGTLVPREEAAVGTELSGYRVLRVLAEEGDLVRRGQALAVLDPTLLREEIARAEVAAERARSEFARVADLKGRGVIADETIEQRGFEARSAASQLRDLRNRQDKLTLRAPVGGLVLSRALRPGDIAGTSGTEPFFRIARDGLLELDAEVPEAEFGRVQIGASVPVTMASGDQVTGKVRLISPRVDQQTKLGRVRVLLARDNALRAGGFASVALSDRSSAVAAVPERAVTYASGGASVSVVDGQNRIRRVPVRTGARGGGYVELREGPGVGARVVVAGAGLVLPGDRVQPSESGR